MELEEVVRDTNEACLLCSFPFFVLVRIRAYDSASVPLLLAGKLFLS